MLRKLLGTGLLLATLSGCTKLEGRTCSSDAECAPEGLCDTSVGLCYTGGTEPELDGGACDPACAAYEACTTGGCRPRFTALNILTPTSNAVLDAGTAQVSAQLVVNPTYQNTTQLPDTLVFSAARSGGGAAGTFGSVTRNGDTYTVPWTPPVAEAQFTLTASHPTPEAVQSAAVNVQVDGIAPNFSITFPNPPARAPASVSQAAEQDPTSGYESAYRRDESVTVRIAADQQVTSAMLTVVGIGPNGAAGQARPAVAVQPGGTCDGSPVYCGIVTVDLSMPEMRDIRGTMEFRVEGQDAAGNRGTASGTLKVTRWKWAFDSAGVIKGSPAVGDKGSIYFGTAETNGKLFALNPSGSLKWDLAIGQISGSPAVGSARTGDEEYVYVAAKASGGSNGTVLYALKGSDKSQVLRCPGTGNFGNSLIESAIAVGTTQVDLGVPGLANVETAIGILNSNPSRLVTIRPDALVVDQCVNLINTGSNPTLPTIPGASLVMKGEDFFYGANASAGPRLTSYSVGTNAPRTNWPVITSHVPVGLVLLGDRVLGGEASSSNPATGSFFSAPQSPAAAGTSATAIYPSSGGARVFFPAIGGGNLAYFGTETPTAMELVRVSVDTPSTFQNVSSSSVIRAGPVLGKNGRLYTVGLDGRVSAWDASNLAQLWTVILPGANNQDVSPTLDCRRDGSGNPVAQSAVGNLYVVSGTSVFSLVVDSPGLDPSAPWPRYQHDGRNTGNPDTVIPNCP